MGSQCKAVGGDFFTAVPPGADAYIMKYILHDWQEQDALRLLKNCYQVIFNNCSRQSIQELSVLRCYRNRHPGQNRLPGKFLSLCHLRESCSNIAAIRNILYLILAGQY
ncbi:methyltransferase [Chitinophaga sp. OAE865]|uniref:methyltransferase n=1 Tax=Chitinophaga sp. OAE865 TaxID=2817898 RepID=UPI001AE9D245